MKTDHPVVPPPGAATPAAPPPGHRPLDPRQLRLHRDLPPRDVPYVPTDDAVVTAMLRFAGVRADDVVYDLGCGDGRIVIAAAKQCGARGVGVDIDPVRITECRENAQKARVTGSVQFHCKSFFETDFSDATVLMLYLLPAINVKLRPRLLGELKPGTRVVANYFGMGDWEPDMRAEAHHRVLHQWIVPARVDGAWRCVINHPRGRRRMGLRLKRRYQVVTGTARVGRRDVPVMNGRLFGDQLTFKVRDPQTGHSGRYACRVDGKFLRGTCDLDCGENSLLAWGAIRG